MQPCHAFGGGGGGVFLERMDPRVAFGPFERPSFLLGAGGGPVPAVPQVDLAGLLVDGDCVGSLLPEVLQRLFGCAGGRADPAVVTPFGVVERFFRFRDEVKAVGFVPEERGDRFEPSAVAVLAFDVVEDVVEVRGAGRLRELLLPIRLAVVSADGDQLADGELVEVAAGPADFGGDAGGFAAVAYVVVASAEPVGDARGGGAEVEHALDGVGFLEDGELFALAVLGDHGFELLERVEVEHEAGHGAGAGLFARGEAAVAGDDPVAFAVWYDGQG